MAIISVLKPRVQFKHKVNSSDENDFISTNETFWHNFRTFVELNN